MKRFLCACLLLTFTLTGCVHRVVTVTSQPPGASVYFDGKPKGETPVSFDPVWYWTHRIQLTKEGYQPVDRLEKIKAPVYLWIPFDLFAELAPWKIVDRQKLHYELVPEEEAVKQVP